MRRLLPAALLGLVLLAGCSSGDDAPAAAPATTPQTSASTPPPATGPSGGTPTTDGTSAGCPPTGYALTGTEHRPTLDVDGDGQADTEWIAPQPTGDGSVQFGVQTASGDAITANLQSASPLPRSLLVADVTGAGELIALTSDGRAVQLWAVSDCQLIPARNASGEQYTFDLGFTGQGTGVGCLDVDGDGVRDLAGLLADGTSVTETAIDLASPQATNGTSRTVEDAPADQLELARSVSCGDLTLAADGVSTGP